MRFLAVALLLCSMPAFAGGRWLGLVVGENRGLVSEETLRFAQQDATRVRDTLVEVGGYRADDLELLTGTDGEGLAQALARLDAKIKQGPVERLFVYVSSHSSDGELHLAGTRYPLASLVEFLKRAPVQVGVLLIDACQSGRVTRLKGLQAAGAPTKVEATGVEGRVLISASGADEYAQESDTLGGSYFTHYFLTGLRGAADTSRDGKVTLDEVYAWAWARTIESTFSTRGGVQRPAYAVDLRGSGQLVLSETSRSQSRLQLDVSSPGHWLVVSERTQALVADVEKGDGALTLAVPPGAYKVQLRAHDAVLERRVVVPEQGGVTVSGADFERASLVRVARKGAEETRLHLSAAGGASSGLVLGLSAQPTASLRLRRDAWLFAFVNQTSLDFTFRQGAPVSGSFEQVEFELKVGAGHRFTFDSFSFTVGLELGPTLIHQSQLPDASVRTSLGGVAALDLELRLKLFGPLELSFLGTGGGALVKKLAGPTLVPRLSATAGLGVTF